MNHGSYFCLDARNAYVATASLGNLGGRQTMRILHSLKLKIIAGFLFLIWMCTGLRCLSQEPTISIKLQGYLVCGHDSRNGFSFIPEQNVPIDSFAKADMDELFMPIFRGMDWEHATKAQTDSLAINHYVLYPADLIIDEDIFRELFVNQKPLLYFIQYEGKGMGTYHAFRAEKYKIDGFPAMAVLFLVGNRMSIRFEKWK